MNLHVLSLVYSYNKTTSNIALTCRDLYTFCWRNGLKVKTYKADLSLQTLDFMLQLGFPTPDLAMWAAYNGDLELLQSVARYGTFRVNENAATGGHLHIIKWLWDNNICFTRSVADYAAHFGHLYILKWLITIEYSFEHPAHMYPAIKGGHLDIVQWMLDIQEYDPKVVTEYAASCGQLPILKWLEGQGKLVGDEGLCLEAAKNGHIPVLSWARDIAVPLSRFTSTFAASYGQIETLKWLKLNGASFGTMVCANLAFGGYLEGLKWARENGCPWDAQTCRSAVHNGQLEVLRWARENGCPWNEDTRQAALKLGYSEN